MSHVNGGIRAAQKRLYRDAPPDGIILALLDENARLRASAEEAHPAASPGGTMNIGPIPLK